MGDPNQLGLSHRLRKSVLMTNNNFEYEASKVLMLKK